MEKKRVEIYDYNSDEVLERLLLSEEQVKLLDYLEVRDIFWDAVRVRVLEDNITFKEI